MEFVRFARKSGCTALLVTQVAKRGLSGPKMVEHVVDVVLVLVKQANGSRVLQVTKNRLGPAPVALRVEMTSRGLQPMRILV
jgi:predicted ATP-dependent serine protease